MKLNIVTNIIKLLETFPFPAVYGKGDAGPSFSIFGNFDEITNLLIAHLYTLFSKKNNSTI